MSKASGALATKADIHMLMEEIGKLYDANERWKKETMQAVAKRIDSSEKHVKRHFDVVVETIRHDLRGANKDKIENHDDRLVRLERHVGLVSA